MTSRAEPFRTLHSTVRLRNSKISLPSVGRPAILRKNVGFFFQNFRVLFLRSQDAEIPQPSSASFDDNRELNTKYYFKIYCYNFSAPPPKKKNSVQMPPI